MRYVVKKKRAYEDDESEWINLHVPNITVYDDEDFTSTGLVDVDGNEICRSDKVPIGFLTELIE